MLQKIRNSTIGIRTNRQLDLKSGEDITEYQNYIQPIIDIKPICNIVRDAGFSNSTGTSIWTTPSDKDFYLVGVTLSLRTDATAQTIQLVLTAKVDQVNHNILQIANIPLNATTANNSISLPIPIKIDRNSNIFMSASDGTANIRGYGSIIGYTEETTKGT